LKASVQSPGKFTGAERQTSPFVTPHVEIIRDKLFE